MAAMTAPASSRPPVGVVDFEVSSSAIDGLLVLRMKQITDARGTVRELFRLSAFAQAGVATGPWQQINATETEQGAIRGLHGENMVKLVAVVAGEAFGAYVDARRESSTFGAVVTVVLTPGTQVLVPAGVGNGFQSVSPGVTPSSATQIRCRGPGMAGVAVHPLDPALGIAWPVAVDPSDPAQLSAKDAAQPAFSDLG